MSSLLEFDKTPSYQSVRDAAEHLRGIVVRTPLLESKALNERLGARLFLKCETLQHTGSFKFRGAYNTLSRLSSAQKLAGVIAYSSGNHAQGVALSAKMLNIPATILMPEDSPTIKLNNTRSYGAKVITYDRYHQSREEIGEKIAKDNNLTLIKPYDNYFVISGQGTTGVEIAEQLKEQNTQADICAAPAGGGGLIAGTSLALRELSPRTNIYAAEPENFDDTSRSLSAGKRVQNDAGNHSICDAIVTPMPGDITFGINKRTLSGGLVVTDDETRAAMRTAFHYFKCVIEPGGAVALAAFLEGKIDIQGKTVVAIASGGNVDPALYCDILKETG
ncbi:threonine/serine dehydratase [Sneathiella sp. HT1-7]|uniref:threonine ammonia-lyase n=1 Tax=Sneathiella sp. HT1-7 TaxID=2887192 RepID=UPI001D144B53|nr:threonine/serine dehydratase [Sneathiella sp. HT1-7]MCC3305054.1 threonine/serine dehydratase [Sneathiella sp. HT1-7]